MNMRLIKIGIDEAEDLWTMQVKSFLDLYEKYQDTETSPATEKIERIVNRLNQPFTYYYYIEADHVKVGAIRVVDFADEGKFKRISPIFILPEYRNRGYAQSAIKLAGDIHGAFGWELDTILQEKGNCHLYEKMGYYQTGKTEKISDRLTLVSYRKD